MSGKPLRLVAIIVPGFLAFSRLYSAVAPSSMAQTQQEKKESQTASLVSCTAERPTVWPREKIQVKVWVPETRRPLQYAWSATGGHLEGPGGEATWDFAGVPPGTYTATVKLGGADDPSLTCSVRVIVLEREDGRGVPRITGRSLLARDVPEAEGFGLYSYLLFANPPEESSRERYEKAIDAYLSIMPDVEALEKYSKRSELNVTYVPVDTDPPKSISPAWVLQHYDFAHALVLLRVVPGAHRDGPYIVSSLKPVTAKESLNGDYLFQDLSTVPPHLISAWIKLFLNQASQEHFWEQKSANYFALRLRTAIGILAVGLPDVQSALNNWIAWRKSTGGP